jgi:pantoate--beta-alanine ligase
MQSASLADLRDALSDGPAPRGLVPLTFDVHTGHLALVRRARMECATLVASLINQVHYGPHFAFVRRPSDPERDRAELAAAKVDVVCDYGDFPPTDQSAWVPVGALGQRWEGARFPHQFPAAATMVRDILTAGHFDRVYLGEKDYQQLLILGEVARAHQPGIEVVACDTVREPDGLAVSASNARLDSGQRARAAALWQALSRARIIVEAGEQRAATVQAAIIEALCAGGITPDYAAVVDPRTLVPVASMVRPARALVAAYVGKDPGSLWRSHAAEVDVKGVVRLTDTIALPPVAGAPTEERR